MMPPPDPHEPTGEAARPQEALGDEESVWPAAVPSSRQSLLAQGDGRDSEALNQQPPTEPDARGQTLPDEPGANMPSGNTNEPPWDDPAGVVAACEPTPLRALEAILFAAHEPLAPTRLGGLVGDLDAKSVRQMVAALNADYDRTGRAFRIEEIAGGYQLLSRAQFHPWLRKLFGSRAESKLSPSAMLTLAIIAYRQPIKRLDMESLRGSACGDVLRALMDKGLVKVAGRDESLGRPLLYGTTRKFLSVFGLGSLRELPKLEELNKP